MPILRRGVPLQAVLTDFDCTLARLFDDRAMKRIWAELAAFYSKRQLPIHEFCAANAYTLWVEAYRWMREHLRDTADAVNQEAARLLGDQEQRVAQKSPLFAGVDSVLNWLQDLSVPVAVVSTNVTRAVEAALTFNKVDQLVSLVLGREDGRVDMDRLKPNPPLIREALNRFGTIDGGSALLIGDSVCDMAAGQRAGVPTIGVTTGECTAAELTEAGAEVVIPSFADFRKFLVP